MFSIASVMSFRAVVAVLLAAAAAAVEAAAQCTSAGSGAQLLVTTSSNATGHWTASVRLERRSPRPEAAAPLQLEVLPSSSRCAGGARTDALLVTLRGPPPPPGPGYQDLPGIGYYKIHEERMTWEQAKLACEAESAYLLIFNSEEEAASIKELLQRYPKFPAWCHIGFHDKEKENQYVTLHGDPLAGYTRWHPGQPDRADERCGSINTETFGLNDITCNSHQTAFICEQ